MISATPTVKQVMMAMTRNESNERLAGERMHNAVAWLEIPKAGAAGADRDNTGKDGQHGKTRFAMAGF